MLYLNRARCRWSCHPRGRRTLLGPRYHRSPRWLRSLSAGRRPSADSRPGRPRTPPSAAGRRAAKHGKSRGCSRHRDSRDARIGYRTQEHPLRTKTGTEQVPEIRRNDV